MDELAALAQRQAETAVAWVAETWHAHGYGRSVVGVFESREAAFEGLKGEPNLTVWADENGNLRGRPRDEDRIGATWAHASPWRVRGRSA